MASLRGASAVLAGMLVVALATGCTGDGTAGDEGRGSASPAVATSEASGPPADPTAEPTVEALLAAAVEALEALEVVYPELEVRPDYRYDVATVSEVYKDLYEEHGLVEGVRVNAPTNEQSGVSVRIDAFPGRDEARGYRASYYDREYIGVDRVDVPGWPDTAFFQDGGGDVEIISYGYVYGPAVITVGLSSVPFDSREEAGAELGTVLDIVHASLEETVPLPE